MIALALAALALLLATVAALRMEKLIDDEHKRFIGEPVHPRRKVITLRAKPQRGRHSRAR